MKIFLAFRAAETTATDSTSIYKLVVANTAEQAKHMVDSMGLVEVWELGTAHMGLQQGPLFEYTPFVLTGPKHQLHRDNLNRLGASRKRWVRKNPPREYPDPEVLRIMSIQTEWG